MFVHYKSPNCFGERKYKSQGCGELCSIPEHKDAVLLKNEEIKGINRDKIAVFVLRKCTHEGHETFKDILFCGFGMSCVMTFK